MSTEWTPGAGARTLAPVEGMLGMDGYRVLGVSALGVPWVGRDGGSYGFASVTPWEEQAGADLRDRATFLLALDELARRVGLDPAGGVMCCRSGRGEWMIRVAPSGGQHAGSPPLADSERRLTSAPPNEATRRQMERRQIGPLWLHVPGIDTDDPIEVLDRALLATKEGRC